MKRLDWRLSVTGGALLFAVGCHQDMWVQPKAKAQSKSELVFTDGANSRPTVMGTVAYDAARLDHEFYTGFDRSGKLLKEFPIAVNESLLRRGQERFRIFCTPCHGELGNGQGFIARRGFTLARPVASYHTDRLRAMPVGHFFDVITNGYGTMYPYRARIKPLDRWAIAAYIRVLQRSEHTPVAAVPAEQRALLEGQPHTADQDAPPELPIGAPPDRGRNVPGGALSPGFSSPNGRTGRMTAGNSGTGQVSASLEGGRPQ